MKTCSILTLAISAVLATGAAHAQFQERALRLGSATPKGHPMLKGADTLVQCAAAKTGGKMKIQSFTDGVLGNDAQMVSAARTGTLDIVNTSTSPIAGVVPERRLRHPETCRFVGREPQAPGFTVALTWHRSTSGSEPTSTATTALRGDVTPS